MFVKAVRTCMLGCFPVIRYIVGLAVRIIELAK